MIHRKTITGRNGVKHDPKLCSFTIDDEITVTLVKFKGQDVCISIDAPPEINVSRADVVRTP